MRSHEYFKTKPAMDTIIHADTCQDANCKVGVFDIAFDGGFDVCTL